MIRALLAAVERDRLVLGLASVFAGLTVVLVALAFAEQLLLLFLAVPFAVTSYLMWFHATGRLRARTRRRARRAGGARAGDRNGRRSAAGTTAGRERATGGRGRPDGSDISRAEAYRTLGLEVGADPAEVRRAYRAKAKEAHPDAEAGDEERFKRINRAYRRLDR